MCVGCCLSFQSNNKNGGRVIFKSSKTTFSFEIQLLSKDSPRPLHNLLFSPHQLMRSSSTFYSFLLATSWDGKYLSTGNDDFDAFSNVSERNYTLRSKLPCLESITTLSDQDEATTRVKRNSVCWDFMKSLMKSPKEGDSQAIDTRPALQNSWGWNERFLRRSVYRQMIPGSEVGTCLGLFGKL